MHVSSAVIQLGLFPQRHHTVGDEDVVMLPHRSGFVRARCTPGNAERKCTSACSIDRSSTASLGTSTVPE